MRTGREVGMTERMIDEMIGIIGEEIGKITDATDEGLGRDHAKETETVTEIDGGNLMIGIIGGIGKDDNYRETQIGLREL